MRKYRTIEVVELSHGEIRLTEDQAEKRRGSLKPLGKGKYAITSPVQFKAGEVIGLVAIPKILVSSFEEFVAPPAG